MQTVLKFSCSLLGCLALLASCGGNGGSTGFGVNENAGRTHITPGNAPDLFPSNFSLEITGIETAIGTQYEPVLTFRGGRVYLADGSAHVAIINYKKIESGEGDQGNFEMTIVRRWYEGVDEDYWYNNSEALDVFKGVIRFNEDGVTGTFTSSTITIDNTWLGISRGTYPVISSPTFRYW